MLLRIVLAASLARALAADEPTKPEADAKVPSLSSVQPLAVGIGATNNLNVRGKNLADLKSLQFVGSSARVSWKFVSKEEPKTEKSGEKNKDGPDQQLEVEFKLGSETPVGTNVALVATGPAGKSKPLPIFVAAEGRLLDEKEPNDGFKAAQAVEPGFCVSGSFSQTTDVDVFRIQAKAGQKLRFEVIAAQLGSSLDSSMSLYDSKGAITSTNDDSVERDPAISLTMALDGDCFIALTSVTDLPAKTIVPYVFKVSIDP